MHASPAAATDAAAAELELIRAAAAALVGACGAAATPPEAARTSTDAEWESRLAAVNSTVGASLRPLSPGRSLEDAASGESCQLAPHHEELVAAVNNCPGNCVTFLPLGLGLRTVTNAVLSHAAAQHPGKHLLVVVDRPAQALSHAQRLRADLGLPTAVFCGGDFLYQFPQQFEAARVLVFTAGLLLRLLKAGVYRLDQAALMLLIDTFTVVRNHPSNTLVREYWKLEEQGHRPRVLGVLASQLPTKPRPFDRLRQNLRKLCHSLQAQLLLPGGAGLVQLEAQLHHDRIQLHSYALSLPEERLASLLQQHLLGLWDVLHEFGLNHFGRLVQFSALPGAATGAAPGAGGTPGTPAGTAGGTAGTPTGTAGSEQYGYGFGGSTAGTPTPPRLLPGTSPLSAGTSPAGDGGSPATPLHGLSPGAGQHGAGVVNSAAAAAAEQPDPMQHDWVQVELQVMHSLWHSNALPSRGDHVREADALALMMHVLDCVRALRLLLEQGPDVCLARLPAALRSLAAFLEEGLVARGPFAGSCSPLKARILQVAAASPLLSWAQQQQADQQQSEQQKSEQCEALQQQQADETAQQEAPQQETPKAAAAPRQAAVQSPGQQRATPAAGRDQLDAAAATGPAAAASAGCARTAALLELLHELAVDSQVTKQKQRIALVARDAESAANLLQVLAGNKKLPASTEVCLMAEAGQVTPSTGSSQAGSSQQGDSDEACEQQHRQLEAAEQEEPEGPDDDDNEHNDDDDEEEELLGGAFMPEASTVADFMSAASAAVDMLAAQAAAEAAAATASAAAADEAAPASAAAGSGGGESSRQPPAAAVAPAAVAKRSDRIVVHVLHVTELPQLQQRIARYQSLIWYSSDDVLHASCQELDSAALSACHKLSAAAAAALGLEDADSGHLGGSVAGSPPLAGRLECHVLATASQVLALGEVRRVDHSLKAAMQLVLLGDTVAEEKLTMLAHRGTAAALEPQAHTVLDMLCLGLCGTAPALATMTASPSKIVAAEVVAAAVEGATAAGAGAAPRLAQAAAPVEPAAEGSRGQLQSELMFQSSVTLPAAYFPSERFHVTGVSMPLDVFVGPPLPSEEQAANAAAVLALAALHRLGIVVRYWPSRLLLAQHLLPRGLQGQALQGQAQPAAAAAAMAAAALGLAPPPARPTQPQQQPPPPQQPQQAGEPPADGSPGAAAAGSLAGQAPTMQSLGGQANVINFFCPLCNVAATGHKAFDAHLRGFRHQRRIKQAQLLQQGQEVSTMLQGLLLEEGLALGGAAPLAVRHPGHDAEEDEGGEYGSPTYADRQVYSPEPTPYRCDGCGVYCTSERLLEAHTRGRKHQRRMAGLDSPGSHRPGSPRAQPLVTPFYCSLCGLYATSEEQLRMHMLGKRHTRMMQLQRQRGALLLGGGAAGWRDAAAGGPSLQQQQHQLLTAAAAAAAAGVGSWSPGVPPLAEPERPSPLSAAFAAGPASGTSTPPSGGKGGAGYGYSYGPPSPLLASAAAAAPPSPMAAGGWATEEQQQAVLQGMLLGTAGGQRIYRCDLCGVVTPSRRHYDYHLQGVKHTRRQMRAQGLDPGGSNSQPGTPGSGCSPGGSRSSSPATRGSRGRHSRHGSGDWGQGGALGGGGGGGSGGEPALESLICSVCGIMATSAINLEDHYKGRRHQKNVERQQAQEAAVAVAIAAAATASAGKLPPLPPNINPASGPFSQPSGGGSGAGGGGPPGFGPSPLLQRSTSGITLGADGLRLSGGALLSTGSVQRLPSGELYDGFPCVRVGDVLLPSSMDLRAFLEEMQHLDAEEEADLLPPIAEHFEAGSGSGGAETAPRGPSSPQQQQPGLLSAPPPAATKQQEAAGGNTWAYSTSSPGPGTAPNAAGAGWSGGGGEALHRAAAQSPDQQQQQQQQQQQRQPYQQQGQQYSRQGQGGGGYNRSQPGSPSFHAPSGGGGGGGYGRSGARPGSAGRLSRFAFDQQQQQQQQQQQALAAAQGAAAYGQLGMHGVGAAFGMQAGGYPMPLAMQQRQQQLQQQQQHMMGQHSAAYSGSGATSYGLVPDYASASAVLAAQQQAVMQQAMQMQQMQQMQVAAAYGNAAMLGSGYGGMAVGQHSQHQHQHQHQQAASFFPPPSQTGQQGRVPPLPPPSSRHQY